VIRYAGPVTADELVILKEGKSINRVPDRSIDRIHSTFYDEVQSALAGVPAAHSYKFL